MLAQGLMIGRWSEAASRPRVADYLVDQKIPADAVAGLEDAELVRRSRAGDQHAFRALVERYRGRIYWVAYHMIHDREEAHDVAQEAFIRVYRALDRFDLERRFYTWLYQIVVHLCIDYLRREKKARRVSIEQVAEPAGPPERVSASLEAAELRERLYGVLDQLPAKYRAVIVLRDVEGLDSREIARVVGCTHPTARWRLHRARAMFRDLWEQAGYPAPEGAPVTGSPGHLDPEDRP
ncbi:MAG: sigma-70 family RNA polymerase sigma factor [Planctomycetes bacterium]|nr:sigma-70 family RNA polymerase sigma factor [Planctomycetota bacterium]